MTKAKPHYRLHVLRSGHWFMNRVCRATGRCLSTSPLRKSSGEAVRRAPR